MTSINLAIEKAVEGGWKFMDSAVIRVEESTSAYYRIFWLGDQYSKNGEEYTDVLAEQIFLDPQFWKCLRPTVNLTRADDEGHMTEPWKNLARSFFDYAMDGGDPESFFKEILK